MAGWRQGLNTGTTHLPSCTGCHDFIKIQTSLTPWCQNIISLTKWFDAKNWAKLHYFKGADGNAKHLPWETPRLPQSITVAAQRGT